MPRLFIAISPPSEAVRAMLSVLIQLEDRMELPPHRATPMAQLHLTAFFIGERSEKERSDVEESLVAACGGIEPFRLRPVKLTALPSKGAKRTVVVECDRPAGLLELRDRLVQRFARQPHGQSRDKFLPHVTIARFPGSGTEFPGGRSVDTPLAMDDFEVDAVRLLESVLRPEGALHRELAVVPLAAS